MFACSRRVALALCALAAAVCWADGAEFVAGADVSALTTLEQHGATYCDGSRKGDAVSILRADGINAFRLRIFATPNGADIVTNDLSYTLALAKRVRQSGAKLLLDFHYSDTWADPAAQTKPKAWAALDFPALVTKVRDYTRDTLLAFAHEGVAPDYVQLGNEITNGMLWPDGRVEFGQPTNPAAWERLGQLLNAAYAGLAEAFPAAGRPRTILHIESPNQTERAKWFCAHATQAGVPFDIIGVSYYPDWHGTIADLRRALVELSAAFRKPVMVVEMAYPWKFDEHWRTKAHMDWPLTPAGQAQFVRDVVAAVRAVPEQRGLGVWYWYPEARLGTDLPIWVGGSCGLFDDNGRVLPAASALR